MKQCIMIRYGEVGLKSKRTKGYFERLLSRAIKDALQKNGISNTELLNYGGRFVLYCEDCTTISTILERIPGIQSFSPAVVHEFKDRDNLIAFVKDYALPLVKDKTFGVKVKRSGMHSFNSVDMGRMLGDELYEASAGVNLSNPDVKINVEIRDQLCFVYTGSVQSMGGLPPTSAGRALALFSGGIDSPVAAYTMMKRGAGVDFCYVNMLGDRSFQQVAQIYNYLVSRYAFGYVPRFYVVDGRKIVERIQQKCPDNLRQVALKIAFYKIGTALAQRNKQCGLITGEALSQKSSQTIQSLALIQSQCTGLILRPLVGKDKLEIIESAREIGTFAYSERVKELCNLSTGPVTTTPIEDDLKVIPQVDDLIEEVLETFETFKGIVPVEEDKPEKVESKFTLIDVRPEYNRSAHPLDADIEIPYPHILDELSTLDKEKTYLVVCDFGVQSEEVAYALRSAKTKAAGVSLNKYLKYFKHLR